jgi:hypothetical protein
MTDAMDALRAAVLADEGVPEPVRRFLSNGATLEEIRLSRLGTWSHQGEAFVNQRLAELFHRSLMQTPSGTWLLRIAPYHYPVVVEGPGAFVCRLSPSSAPAEAVLASGVRMPFVPDALWSDGADVVCWAPPSGPRARLIGQAYQALAPRFEVEGDALHWRRPDGVRVPVHSTPVPWEGSSAAPSD